MPRCKTCKEKFKPRNFLQKYCMVNTRCIAAFVDELRTKKWKVEKKVLKEKLKTLGDYEKDARKVFQKWIRQRDKDLPCISCGVYKSPQFDAGHYFSANQFSGMMFNEDNVHKQCSQCNDYYSGNLLEYRAGLINRFGLEFVERLERTKDNGRNYKYSKDELIEIKNKYKKLLT